jgi:hypothetical protein
MLLRALASFSPRRQPWATRQSYSHELINALTYPVALALVESTVVGVLAAKAFGIDPAASAVDAFLFATIMAAPMFANLTSFVWAWLARGRRKVRFINMLQIATLVVVAAIALLPTDPPGAVMLTLLVVLARCLLSGIITLRSTVWRMNYPRHVRAQITGKLALLQSLIGAVAPLAGYALLDINEDAFRVLYPGSVAIAAIGVSTFWRIRLRHERELLDYENQPTARPQRRGAVGAIYEFDPRQSVPTADAAATPTRENFWSILKRDRTYRAYMLWQFVGGAANMMGEVVVVAAVAQMTVGLRGEYVTAITLTTAIPMLFAVLTLPHWARYLDQVHVAVFRSRQGVWWVGNQAMLWLALLLFVQLEMFWAGVAAMALARVVQGITRGAGMLAWNLGHNDFADRRMVAIYMGIHVTLTGVRGAVAPFIAILLYAGWSGVAISGTTILPGFAGIGYHVFILTTVMALVAERGFTALARQIQAGPAPDRD